VRTMNELPDDHYVWEHMNPTITYYSKNEDEQNNQTRDFMIWYDNQLHNMAELRQTQSYNTSKNMPLYTPKTATETWESSSSIEPNWGRRKEEDHDERLKNWMNLKDRPTQEEIDNAEDPQYQPQQDAIQQVFGQTEIPKRNEDQSTNPEKINHDAKDDEIEFKRIPIAGEHEEDYEEDSSNDDEIEEEEDEAIPIFEPIQNPTSLTQGYLQYAKEDGIIDQQSSEDLAFLVGPVKDGVIGEYDLRV
jgi:hypothetical protein